MDDFELSVSKADPSFTIVRSFAAPQQLIWECYTTPEHMKHFWGPRGSTNPVMELDLKVGGLWRVVMRFESGQEYGYSSVYLEIAAPERLAYRDAPDDWPGGLDGLPPLQLHTTITITGLGDRSVVTVTVRAATIAHRDDIVRRGHAEMVRVSYERMAAYLQQLTGQS